MKVTNVSFRPVANAKNTKAYVDIEFDGILIVKNFRIVDGRNGLFLACPSEKDKKDEKKFYDTVLFKDARKENTPGAEYYTKLANGILRQFKEKIGTQRETASFDQTRTDDMPF